MADELEFYRSLLSATQWESVVHGLPGTEFRLFMEGPFTRTAWYDLVPLVYFASSVATARAIPLARQLRENAHWHVERAGRGFSGLMIRMLSVETVGMWLPRAAALFHDFGMTQTTRTGDRQLRAVRKGVPHFFVQTWGIIGAEFTERTLEAAGAKRPRVFAGEVTPDGERQGEKTYSIPFEISWE